MHFSTDSFIYIIVLDLYAKSLCKFICIISLDINYSYMHHATLHHLHTFIDDSSYYIVFNSDVHIYILAYIQRP